MKKVSKNPLVYCTLSVDTLYSWIVFDSLCNPSRWNIGTGPMHSFYLGCWYINGLRIRLCNRPFVMLVTLENIRYSFLSYLCQFFIWDTIKDRVYRDSFVMSKLSSLTGFIFFLPLSVFFIFCFLTLSAVLRGIVLFDKCTSCTNGSFWYCWQLYWLSYERPWPKK